MEETMTKEEIVEEAIKNNPELAADIAENSIGTAKDGTKVYPSLDAAKKSLGILCLKNCGETTTPVLKHNTKDMRFLSSGVIEDKRFKMTEAKSDKFIINFTGSLTEPVDMINIPSKPGETNVRHFDCDEEIEIIRVVYIHKFGKDGKFETVFHVSNENMTQIGKSHKLYLGDTFTTLDDRNKNAENERNGVICKPEGLRSLKSIVDIDVCSGEIRVASIQKDDWEEWDENREEYIGTDEWYVLPIAVKKSQMDAIDEIVEKKFKENYDEIIDCFIDKSIPEEKQSALKSFIDTLIGGNPNLDKYALIEAFDEGKIKAIPNPLEESSNELDELTIVSLIYPRFGAENIDWNNVPVNEEGNVILTKKDVANIKIFGIPEQIIENILSTSVETIKTANDSISISKESLEKIKSEVYDAKCKLSLEIDGKDWYKSVCDNYKIIQEETSLEANIIDSEEFIKSSKNQIAGFKILSNRIQKKIEHGEFSNTYMLACANIMNKIWTKYKNTETTDENEFDKNIYTKFLEYVVSFYTSHTAKDFISKKFTDMAVNTMFVQNQNSKDKNGYEEPSIEVAYDKYSKTLVSLNGIDEMDDEFAADEIINRVTSRYEFMKAISTAPIQFICRIYPEIAAAINCEDEVSENRKAVAKSMREELGLNDKVDSPEMLEKVKFIVDSIKDIHNYNLEDVGKAAQNALINADEFAKRIGNKRFKGTSKKLSAYARSIVVIDSVKYLEPIATGKMIRDLKSKPLTDSEEKIVISNLITGEEISRNDYDKLNDAEKTTYGVYDILDKLEISRLYADYLIRSSLNSLIFNVIGRMVTDFEENSGEIKSRYADDMFVSTLSLFIPVVSIMETAKISDIEGEFNAMNLVDGGTKTKLGTSSVKMSLGTMSTTDDLKEQRTEYISAALDFVSLVFSIGA